ncbi:pimeloyl-ACP methyl ester carboxylesterase [Paenibacillus cellulosilyticus]|uniref:Pimeloyl-ACP methyl ester carboxylesterase n=2 Tax=Paenibacillus cellulosilyticus TaxID=375489 RepID=A0A2V2YKW0_9BACL|nr:pimeloyl-ACP methyl ester carboxylesterase [Paenibacillus cellulosilyticus]QKS46426.1 alpha/beta hydrolase [Paenibacillus cellulosilyticus]
MSKLSIADRSAVVHNGTLTIAYADSMPEGGADVNVVLLHGYCGSSAYWEQLVSKLVHQGTRVIVPDTRGHGSSSAPNESVYTMETLAGDVLALLDVLQLEQVVLLGHSMGGYTALAFAEQHPSRLRAFGLVHSTGLPDSEAARENRDRTVQKIEQQGVATFVEGLVPNLFAPAAPAELVGRAIEIGYGTASQGAQASALGMKERPDRLGVLETSKLPLLLVAGAKDGIIPVERTFTTDRAGVSQVLLETAGHMGMLESPEQLAEGIRNFLATI